MKETVITNGSKFGQLIVINSANDLHGRKALLCRCICGNTKVVSKQNLVNGNTIACGCLRGGAHHYLHPYIWLYNRLVRRAKKRNIACFLSYNEFLTYTKIEKCHYCEGPLIWSAHSSNGNYGGYNLDRKDHKVGYTKNNVVVCCKRCNSAKSDHFTYEEFVKLGKVMATFK